MPKNIGKGIFLLVSKYLALLCFGLFFILF